MDYVTSITDIRRQMLPSVSRETTNIPGADGVITTNTKLEARPVEVDISVKRSSLAELRTAIETLAGILYTVDSKTMVFSDEPSRIYYGKLDKDTNLEELVYRGKVTLAFTCDDPLKYSNDGKTVNFDLVGKQAAVNNLGTYWTTAKITVNFNAARTNFKLTISPTAYLQINGIFNAGDIFIYDGKTGKITLNGTTNMAMMGVDSKASKFRLERGNTTITLDSAVGMSSAKVEFTERWL